MEAENCCDRKFNEFKNSKAKLYFCYRYSLRLAKAGQYGEVSVIAGDKIRKCQAKINESKHLLYGLRQPTKSHCLKPTNESSFTSQVCLADVTQPDVKAAVERRNC